MENEKVKNAGEEGETDVCLLTVLSLLNKINLKHQMVQDSFLLSDYNLSDHTKNDILSN